MIAINGITALLLLQCVLGSGSCPALGTCPSHQEDGGASGATRDHCLKPEHSTSCRDCPGCAHTPCQTHFKPPLSVSRVLLGQQTAPSSYKIQLSRVSSQSALSAASYHYASIILKLGTQGRANTSGSHQFL